METPPRLGVLRVQLRWAGGQEVRHSSEEHEALPRETGGREGQLQLGDLQGEATPQVSGQRDVLGGLPQV